MRVHVAWVFLCFIVSGCTEPRAVVELMPCAPREPARDIDAITPGCWNVNGQTDHLLVWAHNPGTGTRTGSWSLSVGDDGLPRGWTVTFSEPSFNLRPNGTKQGREYPDWGWTLVTLALGGDAEVRAYNATLAAGNLTADIKIHVIANRGTVSGPGSTVNAHYRGTFQDTGEAFDDGEFPTRLGSGETVPGFDYGLMGLKVGEEASLHVPPALAYGYDNPPGSYAQFNGRWLVFDVRLSSIQ